MSTASADQAVPVSSLATMDSRSLPASVNQADTPSSPVPHTSFMRLYLSRREASPSIDHDEAERPWSSPPPLTNPATHQSRSRSRSRSRSFSRSRRSRSRSASRTRTRSRSRSNSRTGSTRIGAGAFANQVAAIHSAFFESPLASKVDINPHWDGETEDMAFDPRDEFAGLSKVELYEMVCRLRKYCRRADEREYDCGRNHIHANLVLTVPQDADTSDVGPDSPVFVP